MKQVQKGFTLIELMIVVAIIGILAAIAVPSYQNYIKKAKYTEVMNAPAALKTAVEVCVQDLGTATGCTGGTNGIPADLNPVPGNKYVLSTATLNGVITVVPIASGGILSTDTFVLTPSVSAAGQVTWVNNGATTSGCIATQLCK